MAPSSQTRRSAALSAGNTPRSAETMRISRAPVHRSATQHAAEEEAESRGRSTSDTKTSFNRCPNPDVTGCPSGVIGDEVDAIDVVYPDGANDAKTEGVR